MSIPVVTFFNNKGGVGKTSMVYHLSWILADLGARVIAADLDPQSNLTAAFLDEDRLEEIMTQDDRTLTMYGSVKPLKEGTGDIAEPHVEIVGDRLGLIPGHMSLSLLEDDLAEAWPKCLDNNPRAFRVISAFWRIVQGAGNRHGANVILVDLGPNLGAINRAALIGSNFVAIPLGPDLFSLQGLTNLGPVLRGWRGDWKKRREVSTITDFELPLGDIVPIGYLVLRHSVRLDRPVQAFERWIAKIPETYSEAVLGDKNPRSVAVEKDPNCLARLKDYRSLMPLAQEAHKPMFFLKPADGALGAHTYAVTEAYKDFESVARKVAAKAKVKLP